MPVILSVNRLSKKFKDLIAVDDLSFTVNEGDVYGFLGQNGAGKSTTIRMLLSLIKPSSGEIEIFGKNLFTHRTEILKETGAVIEKPDLYKYLSAYQNLFIFAKMSGIKVNRHLLMEQLEMVGLAERADSKVKTFSQGMKQRLGIAVALAHDPRLIVLDEPTNGLDPQGIADMRNLILKLSKEMGKTIVVSSHLLSEIEIIANRILIINKGRKVVEGNAAALLDPAKTIVQIDTLNNSEAKDKLMQSKWASFVLPSADAIKMQMNKNGIPELTTYMTGMNIGILSIQPRHSLEDYFLSLTTQQYVDTVKN
ncbi:ABC transporter ATP-binding protein [Ferruginibacter sp. SUN106]|uniref:ABC transporter ATP-binding protein n=1 Tax=Ferruginibacter sp. SUN106 TaxID=2978348 RepID=UPI003D35E69A